MPRTTFRFVQLLAVTVAGGLSLAGVSQTVSAQLMSSTEKGKVLAEKLCTSCHIVGTSVPKVVNADVPSFTAIANRANQTPERIAGRLISPHPPMPNFSLTRNEIAHLAAYILTFRK